MIENETLSLKKFGHFQSEKSSLSDISIVTPGVYYPVKKLRRRFPQKSFRRQNERAISKNGDINVEHCNTKPRFILTDWFVTMVEARWRWTLLNFFMAFTADWLFFGFIYWISVLIRGDLSHDHLPPNQNETDWTPCIKNIYGFTSTFLFSIEVHTTVAYGHRKITLECPEVIFTMCLQCIVSSIFQAFLVGILFAKLTRPKARTQTILFSKNAVVNLKNEKLCLVFRVGDMRKSRILNIKSSVYLIRMNLDQEHMDEDEQLELQTTMDGCESTFFLWPLSIIHVIDEKSPLYGTSAADILCGKLELLVVFEGTIESTGQVVQARTSYIESDILWGHRFVPLVDYNFTKDIFNVDFSKLNETVQVDTPLCSACEYNYVVTELNMIDFSDTNESL